MVPNTRRRFLHVATAVAGGLAGCSQLTGDETRSSGSASENGASNFPDDDTETNPPAVLLRSESDVPPIHLEGTDDDYSEASGTRPSPRIHNEVIGSPSSAEALTVAADADAEAVDQFISETDLENETLYLEVNRVRSCFRLELCRIAWQSDGVHTDYVRTLRSYDEQCSTDTYAYESRLVRLPVVLDEESVTGYGSSINGGGDCGRSGPRGAAGGRERATPTPTPEASTDGGDE